MRFATFPVGALVVLLHTASALSPRLRALRNNAEKDHQRRLVQTRANHVSQTYYVPLPEKELNLYTFREIFHSAGGPDDADQVIVSIIALSIGVDNTIVWYDHVEDGYETDLKSPAATSTQIWGDGKASNGCAPSSISIPCTDENDFLEAGRSIVLENDVHPYVTEVKYGSGDKICASLPVTVTRGAYPDYPGSVLAGAVEVMHTGWWGTTFETALSTATTGQLDFNLEYVGVYIQATEDNTTVTFPNGTNTTLDEGETGYSEVNSNGVTFGANKKVQVHMLTGDKGSLYELRWYSLMPVGEYDNEYWSPVGDRGGGGGIKVLAYNPHDEDIIVSSEVLQNGDKFKPLIRNMTCPAKGNCWSLDIPDGSGGKYFSEKTFLAFAVIDTGTTMFDRLGHRENAGGISDWGFPLVPAKYLSPQVLVGWGYGCGGLNCAGGAGVANGASRSVVWVTVMENAAIYVDYDNDGHYDKHNKKTFRLQSRTYKHDEDNDMSGSVIWAVKYNHKPTSTQKVLLAAAWGQDPDLTNHKDKTQALDLGTVVMPMQGLDSYKTVELVSDDPEDFGTPYAGIISAGDTIKYTITVTNVGQVKFLKETVLVQDVLSEYIDYVQGSTVYMDSAVQNNVPVSDGAAPDFFPLENGVSNVEDIQDRGGFFQISFQGVIDFGGLEPGPPIICNSGNVTAPLATSTFEKCFIVPPDERSSSITFETESPSPVPSFEPSFDPTDDPSLEPSLDPTDDPSLEPSLDPTDDPSNSPSDEPTVVDEEEECPEDEVLLLL